MFNPALFRLELRKNRAFIISWLLPLLAIPIIFIPSYSSYYPSQESRTALVAGMNANLGTRAMYGPVSGSDSSDHTTLGQLFAWEGGMWLTLLGSIFLSLLLLRLYRSDESTSLGELIPATGQSRATRLGQPLLFVSAMAFVLGGGVTCMLSALQTRYGEYSISESLWFGASLTLATLGSAMLTAVIAVLLPHTATVRRNALFGILGAFLLRAIADTQTDIAWVNWLTPLGWPRALHAFEGVQATGLKTLPLVLLVAATTLIRIDIRRGFNQGILPTPSERQRKPRRISGPLTLRLMLDKSTCFTWNIVALLTAAFFATLTGSIHELLEKDETSGKLFKEMFPGQQLEAAFLTYSAEFLGILLSVGALTVALTWRREEKERRTDLIRAAGTTRATPAYLASFSTFTAALQAVLCAAVGAVAGTCIGSTDPGEMWKVAAVANLSQIFPVLTLVGFALFIQGIAPKFSATAWVPLVVCATISLVGKLLKLDEKVIEFSVLGHTWDYSQHINTKPQLLMLLAAITLTVLGVWAAARRDIR